MKTTQDLVRTAEETLRIGIVEIGTRHAYYAAEARTWYWLTVSDMRHASVVAASHPSDAYSRWCAETSTREVSARVIAREGL